MKIDLLPPDVIPLSFIIRSFVKKTLCGILWVIVVAVLASMYFGVVIGMKKNSLSTLETKQKEFTALKANVNTLQKTIDSLNKESILIDRILSNKFYWSEKLSKLVEMIPVDMWLAKISIKNGKQMSIKGYLLPTNYEDRPIAILSKFIRTIQDNTGFAKDFSEISLVDTQAVKIKDKEVFEFNINLLVKE